MDLHWIAGAAAAAAALRARRQDAIPDARCACARSSRHDDGVRRATFDAPQWAPTPGQYLVLYDGDVCLGGGVIAGPQAYVDERARVTERGLSGAA